MALRDYILHNFWWKLSSLLLAALTWLTIQTSFRRDQNLQETPVVTSSKRTFPAVPVTLLNSPANSNRFHIDPTTVAVDVSGTASELSRLQETQIRAYVDVSNAGDEMQFRRNIQAQVPGGLKVEHLAPAYTQVERLPSSK